MALLSAGGDLTLGQLIAFLQSGFALLILHRIWVVVYNLYIHPLKKYPGPKSFAISHLPMLYHLGIGDGHAIVLHLHERYGPVVRIGPDELSFLQGQAWKDIYGYRGSDGETFQKDIQMLGPDLHPSEKGMNRADDSNHVRQRRIFSHAFSDRALREQEPLIRGYVDTMIQSLRNHSKQLDKPIDLGRMYIFASFDIMADLTFGEPLGMLQNSEYVPWVADLSGYPKAVVLTKLFRTYPLLRYIGSWLQPKSLIKKRQKHIEYSIQRVDRRLEKELDRGDIWSLVMRHAGLNNITKWEMYSNARSFMTAGTETTSTLLSGATYLLLKNSDKLARLVREIRSVESPQELNITNLQHLTYLNACLEEALRFYPPAPNARTRVTPRGGVSICDNFVPEGTKVGIPFYASSHSPLNFRDPWKYAPERWLPEGAEYYGTDDKAAMKPFSFGPRNCLGKNLAWHEMRLMLSSVLWHFDLTLADPHFDWLNQESYMVWLQHPLPVVLTPACGTDGGI